MSQLIKTCTGFGHREIYKDMTEHIYNVVTAAVKLGCEEFLCGGYGEFDRQFASCVHRAKREFPHKNIKLSLVLPYYRSSLKQIPQAESAIYDELVFPEEIENVHPKAAIKKRNRWMVEHSDMVLCYISHHWGGAYEAVKYARRRGVFTRNLYHQPGGVLEEMLEARYARHQTVEEIEKDKILQGMYALSVRKAEKELKNLPPIDDEMLNIAAARLAEDLFHDTDDTDW